MSPSWWKNRTLSHFSKPNFDMPWPNCWKSYKVNGYPQFFLLVQKNMYSQSPLCARSLTPVLAEIWFFKSLDRGCRTKGPLPNLGRLTVCFTFHTMYGHVQLSFLVVPYNQGIICFTHNLLLSPIQGHNIKWCLCVYNRFVLILNIASEAKKEKNLALNNFFPFPARRHDSKRLSLDI